VPGWPKREGPLFQAIKVRPYGRGEPQLNGERLHRINAWAMVRRQAKAAGITTDVSNHTFRGTGITANRRTGVRWRRHARWQPMPPPARPSSKIASLSMKW
jgi:integrase